MSCDDICAQIVFYLDNELGDEDRAAFEAHLSACPSCREELTRDGRFLDRIRSARALYPAPAALRSRVAALLEKPGPTSSSAIRAPTAKSKDVSGWRFSRRVMGRAAIWVLTVAGLLSLNLLDVPIFRPAAANFAEAAAEAHRRHLRGALPLELASDNPATVSGWFQGKLSFSLALPSYPDDSSETKPYRIRGARLLGFNNNDAAYVAYEMAAMPISLVVTSSKAATPSGGEKIASGNLVFHYQEIGGYKVITWSDRGLTYALVSAFEGRGQQSCEVCHDGEESRGILKNLNL